MQKKSINLFVTLLENIMAAESSTAAQTFGSSMPDAKILIQYLHKQKGLEHDQRYDPVKKISWSEIKAKNRWGTTPTHWVLIKGTQGVGAISATDSYEAIAVYDGQIVRKVDDRGGNILDWLKGYIGTLQTFYVGKSSGEARKKKKERAAIKPVPSQDYTTIDNFVTVLLKKV